MTVPARTGAGTTPTCPPGSVIVAPASTTKHRLSFTIAVTNVTAATPSDVIVVNVGPTVTARGNNPTFVVGEAPVSVTTLMLPSPGRTQVIGVRSTRAGSGTVDHLVGRAMDGTPDRLGTGVRAPPQRPGHHSM